ncbi:hypothetical protein EJ05DRAFT_502249 [Pseudovirgaria hyperparasitica]|uniref:Uncharacterized protein n=1 Tax=Pseudovirgaria hyperparasitica TaxID=470096 RepID=A0A6A6W461_9PEZI|nr:uncharacterized protein EJ05DRAFT_502249 [Pseudovirgaria hyperparasitica]KAF2756756.1 hypothetical protein EJ05DRAFT_502249 [Pseudovirgaria hyperparasitica]
MPPSRQPTSRSDAGRSLRERLTQPLQSIASKQRAPSPQRYPWKIGIYNGVTWPKLKAHLETLFPGTEFKERTKGDYWIVKVPAPSTTDRKNEILQLRDDNRAREPSLTPEPGMHIKVPVEGMANDPSSAPEGGAGGAP